MELCIDMVMLIFLSTGYWVDKGTKEAENLDSVCSVDDFKV